LKRALALLLCPAFASLALAASGQDAPAPAVTPPAEQAVATAGLQARTLAPFSARYAVFRGGDPLGDATMQVVKLDGPRWRVDLSIRASRGLLRIAGLNLQQSTLFTVDGDDYRPLTQSTVRHALFSNKQTTGIYDWAARKAQWQGDVKKTRRAPVALQDGDMSGLLINLAVLRDAQPGATLRYRFVDDGRVREQQYVVAPQREPQSVEDMAYDAMRVSRVHAGGDETVLWVVEGVPTPIRILQREGGKDALDLRLVEYTGA
jgi:hypothetical protein